MSTQRLPDRVWTTLFWCADNNFEPVMQLWESEEAAKAHAKELVSHVLTNILCYGEHYVECAKMDMLADWGDGLGTEWESDCQEYFFKVRHSDIWTLTPTGGLKTRALKRADRGKMLRYQTPEVEHRTLTGGE